ncbi:MULTISPECIES: hypothetical protein [unclassified Streptomyces]|uniref:hypothetical protein n=1 Tax=unclassified Streptomyces TaxID=2593676 RepID=UPI00331D5F20
MAVGTLAVHPEVEQPLVLTHPATSPARRLTSTGEGAAWLSTQVSKASAQPRSDHVIVMSWRVIVAKAEEEPH